MLGLLLAASLQLIPNQAYVNYTPPSVKAKIDVQAIVQSLTAYANNNGGSYPDSLVPLVMPDTNGHAYLEGYNGKIPKDPWKREYLYDPPTPEHPRPRVRSLGSDGKPGGSGTAEDIDSEELRESDR